MLFHAHAQARLGDEVAERHRRGQFAFAPVLDPRQLLHQQVAGDVVHDQMVLQQRQQPALAGRIERGKASHLRRAAHVDAVVRRVGVGEQLRLDIGAVEGQGLDLQPRLAPHHLHRLAEAFPQHRGAQHVVAVDGDLQRAHEAVQALARVERERGRQQVGIA
ncbi:hypothetical protein CATMIT_01588, partial [Catenibacterium mitsuokai DSM 15897]